MSNKEVAENEVSLNSFFKKERQKNLRLINLWLTKAGKERKLDAEDIYQDSALALYENITCGKYVKSEKASLKTYFTQICKYQTKNKIKGISRDISIDNLPVPISIDDLPIDNIFDNERCDELSMPLNEKYADIRTIVSNLPKPCNKILWGFYFDKLSMKEIACMLGYKNANVAKTKKSQCMSKLELKLT